jgi:hypothetical protein
LSITTSTNVTATSDTTVTGHSLAYTVPTTANRILVTWNFECSAPDSLISPDQLFATMIISAGTAVGPNNDSVMCADNDILTTTLQRAFDVTSGATVTVSMQARVSNGTGAIDDSYITITAGRQ